MKNLIISLLILIFLNQNIFCQIDSKKYVDSIFNSLSIDEKIGQLLMVTANSKKEDLIDYIEIEQLINKYNIGSLIFMKGSPTKQAELTNYYQSIAKTPLLIFMDAEYGVGMRLDSVTFLPFQIMLGAIKNKSLVYDYGKIVANQCKRLGVNFNLAPVVDINSNPNNPIIGYRSFGEDVNKISSFATQYINALQDIGVYACVKHFPGHGDVDVDSHEDLPILYKKKEELDKLELIPFSRTIKDANVKAVLIAHLSLPKIINSKKIPSSISEEIIKNTLKSDLDFKGLVITDALNMKGFKKFVEDEDVAIKVLKAGNDILCMPENIPFAISSIKNEMAINPEFEKDIYKKVKKIIQTKIDLNVFNYKPIQTKNLVSDLNSWQNSNFMDNIVQEATTLAKLTIKDLFKKKYDKITYISIGESNQNILSKTLSDYAPTNTIFFNLEDTKDNAKEIFNSIKNNQNELIVVGVHNYNNNVKNNFGISKEISYLINKVSSLPYSVISFFGNPYVIKMFENAPNIIVAYNNSNEAQIKVAEIIKNTTIPQGVLPVSINKNLKYNSGENAYSLLFDTIQNKNVDSYFKSNTLNKIDDFINRAISERTFPGCQLFVSLDNKVLIKKNYGKFTYESDDIINDNSIYDIASLTKIFATTLAIMKLVDDKKISINDEIKLYLPNLKSSNKAKIKIKDLLCHNSGLISYISCNSNIDENNSENTNKPFSLKIKNESFLMGYYKDSIYEIIKKSPLGLKKYLYSDIGFILLGQIIESITKKSLEDFVRQNFYTPLGLSNIYFNPLEKLEINNIVPTEKDESFRNQLLKGDVHDCSAAILNGKAGHAGLFSNSIDLAVLCQLLLNKGNVNNKILISKKTIEQFTSYANYYSRRGLGFDKPEKAKKRTYPSQYISNSSFGHTGFTGTSFWVDPEKKLTFIFLSNRIHPNANNKKIQTKRIRENILDLIYENLKK